MKMPSAQTDGSGYSFNLIFLGIAVFAYMGLWGYLELPFRYFPSDDIFFQHNLNVLKNNISFAEGVTQVLEYHIPVFIGLLWALEGYLRLFLNETKVVFLVFVLLSNGLTLFALTATAYRAGNGNRVVAAAAFLIFAASSWPSMYYSFMVVNVLTSALSQTVILLVLVGIGKGGLGGQGEKGRPVGAGSARVFFVAGAVAGLCVWSSSSAGLTIGVITAFLPIVLRPMKKYKALFISYFSGALIVWGALAVKSHALLFDHLKSNIQSQHKMDAIEKFGTLPDTPFFSYFRISMVHSPVLTAAFAVAVAIMAYLFLRGRMGDEKAKKTDLRFPAFLTAVVVVHAISIDLLPFTKLARSHFAAYPVMVLATVCTANAVYQRAVSSNKKAVKALWLGFAALLLAIVFTGVLKSAHTHSLRLGGPDFLAKAKLQGRTIYLLNEDPHHLVLNFWLEDLKPIVIPTEVFFKFMQSSEVATPADVLLVGPTGEKSGLSIMSYSTGTDFMLDYEGMDYVYLPYYAYHPPFLLEEEVSQALYLSGQSPDNNSDNLKLKAIFMKPNKQ